MTKKERIGNKELGDNLNRIHEWIKNADQKISILLAFIGVFLTLTIPQIGDWYIENSSNLTYLTNFSFIIAFGLTVFSLIKLVTTLSPALDKKKYPKSLLYFGDIAKLEVEDFRENISTYTKDKFRNDLIDQIYICSVIAKNKHNGFGKALMFFLGAVTFISIGCLDLINGVPYGNC